MTAVDRAELKRLAVSMSDPEIDGYKMPAKTANVWAARLHALISDSEAKDAEIEGLKAERDAYREAAHLEAVCGDDAERQLTALRNQAPDSWRPDREAVRKVVDWLADEIGAAERGKATTRRVRKLYAKDEAVNRITAALRPQTAESGE